MIRRILTVAAFLGFLATVSSCTKETENDPVTINAKDEVNVSVLAGKIVTVDFRTDGIAGAETPAAISVANGDKIKLPKLTLSKEAAEFMVHKGWSDGTNFYEPEKEYDVTGNTVFNAVWAFKPLKQEALEGLLKYVDFDSDEVVEIPLEGTVKNLNKLVEKISEAISHSNLKVVLDLSRVEELEKVSLGTDTEEDIEQLVYLYGLILPETVKKVTIYGSRIQEFTIPKYVVDVTLKGNNKLTSLKFEDGSVCDELTIEEAANLESIDLPKTSLCSVKIANCPKLKSIEVTSSYLDEWAFEGCTALESVTLNESISEIKDGTFFVCESLKSITIPKTVTEIGASAFAGCKSLQSIVIPSAVKEIGSSAFAYCESLTSVEVKVKTEEDGVVLPDIETNIFGSGALTQYDAEKEERSYRDNLKITFTKPDGKKAKKSEIPNFAECDWRTAVMNVLHIPDDDETGTPLTGEKLTEYIDSHFDFEKEDETKTK
ncbi:MAG: leucine-rich repeat domain-containing protein [Bacteroidales bacterium]|nr:leucine-rich repeat domain-containing protein [Bacteroidales bacterium]